jgi:hypothetical protein
VTWTDLIEKASGSVLRPAEFDEAARSAGVSPTEFTEAFARAVAERFEKEQLFWDVADAAMNWLFAYGTTLGGSLAPLAWRVYEAFDEGEYTHLGEPDDRQGELRTKALLQWALNDDKSALAPFRPQATAALVRAAAVTIAKRALAGELTAIVAVRELVPLRARADIRDNDPDFATLAMIASRTSHLPLGDVRKWWAADALLQKDAELATAEEWAQTLVRPALLSIVQRFESAA